MGPVQPGGRSLTHPPSAGGVAGWCQRCKASGRIRNPVHLRSSRLLTRGEAVGGRRYAPRMGTDERPNSRAYRLGAAARDGIVGNAAWGVVVLLGLAAAAVARGSVPAWLMLVSLLVVATFGALVVSSATRRAGRVEGERDEARLHEARSSERLARIEEAAERDKRELREQLAQATRGQAVVSTRMQSLARQIVALSETPVGYSNAPSENQIEILVALLEDFRAMTGGDPLVDRLLGTWRDQTLGRSDSAWFSALKVLEARALSKGTEEALG